MSKSNIRSKVGDTVKKFGHFHLKRFEVYKDDRQIPSNQYFVTLDNEDGSEQGLGFIESEKSTLSEVLNHLHTYQYHEYIRKYRVKLASDQEEGEARVKALHYLAFLEQNYVRVDHAIRELEPDYEADESIRDIPHNLSDEDKGMCRFS